MDHGSGTSDGHWYRYRFGAADFDESRFELRVGGLVVDLEQKPLQVLALLLRHADEVVTKEELFDTVWAGRITVDNVLANAVAKLRKALGDGDSPRIVTLPRIGYRLTGPVERIATGRRIVSRLDLHAGMPVPGREHFRLEAQVGQSLSSEVWLARHDKTREPRIYKFSPDGEHLGALKREATLYRLLTQSLGERDDFVRIHDWNFERAPFYLECEYGGDNLAQWAERDGRLSSLSGEGRLALFLQIADAVAAAHSVGVLHKDLKPANVLVAPRGDGWQVRVVDFGSGRLLEPGRLEELGITGLGMTLTQNIAARSTSGTPLYLAPELIAGQAPTVQSDVYALGLMLYQIVIGDLRKPMAPGWEAGIADALLREDIAAATDGNPERRLHSVGELQERLRTLDRRHLQRERAREAERQLAVAQRTLERTQARRPWLLAAGISLAVGLSASLWLYGRAVSARGQAEAERAQARQEAARVEAINAFLNRDLLAGERPGDPGFERNPSFREVLDRAAREVESKFPEDALIQADIHSTLGGAFGSFGDYAAAADQFRRAATLYTQSVGDRDPRTLKADYGLVRMSAHLSQFKDTGALLAAADEAATPQLPEDPELALAAYMARSTFHFQQLQLETALADYEAGEAVRRRVRPDDAYLSYYFRHGIADCALRLRRYEQAESTLQALLQDPFYSSQRIGAHNVGLTQAMLARLLRNRGRYNEAAAAALASVASYESIGEGDGPDATISLSTLESIYDESGQLDRALATAREVYRRMRSASGDNHQATLVELGNLGMIEHEAGHLREAVDALTRAERGLRTVSGAETPLTQVMRYNLAWSLSDAGEPARALELLATLKPAVLNRAEPSPNWTWLLDGLRGQALIRQGHREAGRALLESAVARLEKSGDDDDVLSAFRKTLQAIGGNPRTL